MAILKKKNIVLGSLVLLLIVASFANYKLFNKNVSPVAEDDNPNNAHLVGNLNEQDIMDGKVTISATFFTDYRIQRDSTRSENIETLEGIVNNQNSSKTNVDEAQKQMMALVELSEKELLLENMIKSKGFKDCVVFIHEGYVNVLVDAESITAQQAIQIQDIVAKEMKIELSKISIASSGNKN